MANKLSKRYFGATGSAATPHLPIRFKSGGTVYEGFIVNQVSARRFKCSTDDGTTAVEICKLVAGTNSDPANNGEATLVGMLNGSPKTLRKINFRTVADFNSVRYKWTLSDDSTETLLILTAI
jgi:hypothetical protein